MNGLKHQKEKRRSGHFAGLDVSVKETSVCIVDETGKIVWEKVASKPTRLGFVVGIENFAYASSGLDRKRTAYASSGPSRLASDLC